MLELNVQRYEKFLLYFALKKRLHNIHKQLIIAWFLWCVFYTSQSVKTSFKRIPFSVC
jgi:hypothetical protein